MAHDDANSSKLGKAVIRGVSLGIPAGIAFLGLAMWLFFDQEMGDALATALLPGVLLGAFAGGFVGVTLSMD